MFVTHVDIDINIISLLDSVGHAVYTFYPVTLNVLFFTAPSLLVCLSRLTGTFFPD